MNRPEMRYARSGDRAIRRALEDRCEHELKGAPDRWHLYRVVP